MHIGLYSDEYPPYPLGGVGARVTDLARGLVQEGHAVTVVGVYSRNRGLACLADERLDGVRVVRMPQSPQWMRWRPGLLWDRRTLSAQLQRLHRETPFDLFEFTDGRGFGIFGAPRGVPMAVRIDGTVRLFDDAMKIDGDRFYYWMEGRALRKADHLAAPSVAARDATLRLFGLTGRDCAVIHNAVDTDLFCPGPPPPTPGLIVCTNSIEPRKGAPEMILAMNEIAAAHPHARLVFVGSDTQPRLGGRSYSERLLDEAKPEIRDRITFAGRLDRATGVLEYLRNAQVCCYPCQSETFGIAPLEAMAVGKPVIYSDTGPGPELIEHGISGLLCDTLSPASIAAAVRRVLEEPGLDEKLGREARARAVAMFGKQLWIRQNIAYYEACLAGHGKKGAR